MKTTSASKDLLHQAAVALDEGRPDDALALVQAVLASDPSDLEARFVAAEAHRDMAESLEAEHLYRQLLLGAPDHADAWAGLGASLLDQCRFDEAARAYGRALRLNGSQPDALYGRAMLRERRGDTTGARRDYCRAWQASPRHPMPRLLDNAEVDALLREAAAGAEPTVAAMVQGAQVLVLDVPEPITCSAYDPPASPATLLGHFAASFDADLGPTATMPPTLLMYRRNLERYVDDRDRLVVALRDSVLSQVDEWLQAATLSE